MVAACWLGLGTWSQGSGSCDTKENPAIREAVMFV